MPAELQSTSHGQTMVLTIRNPEHRNALAPEICAAAVEALSVAETVPELRSVVITGEGASFCAGSHLQGLLAYSMSGDETALQLTANTDQSMPYMSRHLREAADAAARRAAADIGRLPLVAGANADGSARVVRLDQVARVREGTGANQINRRDLTREIGRASCRERVSSPV